MFPWAPPISDSFLCENVAQRTRPALTLFLCLTMPPSEKELRLHAWQEMTSPPPFYSFHRFWSSTLATAASSDRYYLSS